MISQEYLESTFFIDSESKTIVNLAQQLSEKYNDKVKLTIATFNYIRDQIKYTIDVAQYTNPEDLKGSITIQKKIGFCIPKSVALVALLRANKIPARLHFADIINHRIPPHLLEILQTNVMVFHGYAEVYLGKWIKLTPSFQTSLCERHNFPVCTFDGVNDATFKPYDNAGNLFVEYISDRGTYADLPYEEIFTTFREYYGNP